MPEPAKENSQARFDWLAEYRHIEQLAATGKSQQIGPYLKTVAARYPGSRYMHVLLGMTCAMMNAPMDAVKSFEAAVTTPTPEPLPEISSPATMVYVQTQSALRPEDCPSAIRARANLHKNLAALQRVDPDLAEELAAVPDDPNFRFVDLWGRIHLYNVSMAKVVVISQPFLAEVKAWLDQWAPLGFPSVISGQELPYVLTNQRQDFIHGRKRIIYLMEPDPACLRLQLHVHDFSHHLRSGELVILTGQNVNRRIDEFFDNGRHSPPVVLMGQDNAIKEPLAHISVVLDPTEHKRAAEEYYRSEEFARRLHRIAAGEILPRVQVQTCRWTTFLRYCAKDFQKAFETLGCSTRYIIEEDDLQSLTPKCSWKALGEFKPDFMFGVSHARPSFQMPWELPHISFIQDRCGPILRAADLAPAISPRDLLVCMATDLRKYLVSKNVPEDQTLAMPIPADETMFYPLTNPTGDLSKYTAEVGFVKHSDGLGTAVFENFIRTQLDGIENTGVRNGLKDVFTELYRWTEQNETRFYGEEILEFVRARLSDAFLARNGPEIRQLVDSFYITVHASVWRYQFLNALAEAGLDLALYGKGWEKHPTFHRFARGCVDRTTELNNVYNFNRICLNIHPSSTMHQRVSECALAGGFMLDLDHPVDKDWESVRSYFEPGREIVLFENARDLVDKCRYYLAHPAERRAIAMNFRTRALAEQTVTAAARRVLDEWRKILRRTL